MSNYEIKMKTFYPYAAIIVSVLLISCAFIYYGFFERALEALCFLFLGCLIINAMVKNRIKNFIIREDFILIEYYDNKSKKRIIKLPKEEIASFDVNFVIEKQCYYRRYRSIITTDINISRKEGESVLIEDVRINDCNMFEFITKFSKNLPNYTQTIKSNETLGRWTEQSLNYFSENHRYPDAVLHDEKIMTLILQILLIVGLSIIIPMIINIIATVASFE